MDAGLTVGVVSRIGGVPSPVEGGDVLDDAARERLGREPDALENRIPLGMVEKLLGNSVLAEGGVHLLVVEQLQQGGTAASDPAIVFNADDQSMVTRQVHDGAGPTASPSAGRPP